MRPRIFFQRRPGVTLVDADGDEHLIRPAARICREAGNPRIENRIIEDLRRQIVGLDPVEDRHGNARVRPFLAIGCFASELFLGQLRVLFHETLDLGDGTTARVPVVLHRADGLRRLRTLVELDACVDRVIVALCFEIEFDGCAVDELLGVIVCDVRGWRFADDGTIAVGTCDPPLPPPFDTGGPGIPIPVPEDPVPIGGRDGETPITEGRTTRVPVIDRLPPCVRSVRPTAAPGGR